jgi:site-specific DNA-methyltransferase (adenine-specific)
MNVHFSQESDEWASPQNVFDQLNVEFAFTLDAAGT